MAEVDGVGITAEEVDDALGRPLSDLERQIYNLKQQKLEELINERLVAAEAKRRGISTAALIEQEVETKIVPVTDEEISTLYDANKARIPVPLDQVREQIREFLYNQRFEAQRALFIQGLRAKANVVTYLKAPPVFRAEVSVNGAPFKGAEEAKVTLVKFEDFHCPFCKQIQPAFIQLLSKYDGKLKLVHRDFPIDSLHPRARRAAEAARCAGDQGEFWAYHDLLYGNAPRAEIEDLKAFAKEVGVDSETFAECLGSDKYRKAVEADLEEGRRLGITGTPTFFINGRVLSGAQTLEAFSKIIDEELALPAEP